jgi:diguanylate cyclase (GGDEF)-like protein
MFFPTLEQIATRAVISTRAEATVGDTVTRMLAHDLRDIIVEPTATRDYGIFTVSNLIDCSRGKDQDRRTLGEIGYDPLPCASRSDNVLQVFPKLQRGQEYLGVTDEEGKLWGIVSYTDIVASIDPQVLIERQSVGEIFHKIIIKSATPTQPLIDVLAQLDTIDDAAIVLDEGRIAGILTTKDAIRLFDQGIDLDRPVATEMSSPVETINKDVTIKQALDFIRNRHYKRIVVEDKGKLLGVITQRELVSIAYNRWVDLLRSHAKQLQEVVGMLEEKSAELEVLATTDNLTGIANRTKLQHALSQEISRARRYPDQPLSIVLVDVDRFKGINDRYGHHSGDLVLKQLAALLEKNIREIDLAGRWGGEEFMLLLPHTKLEQATLFAERLRKTIAGTRFEIDSRVTVSLGVSQYQPHESLEQLFQRVDEALYRAKDHGRDRVEATR